jgi:hypothetical protein
MTADGNPNGSFLPPCNLTNPRKPLNLTQGVNTIERMVHMAYSFTNSKGKTYYLHCKKVSSSSGKTRDLFYFAGDLRPEFAVEEVPAGKHVVEMKSGLPVLKKTD